MLGAVCLAVALFSIWHWDWPLIPQIFLALLLFLFLGLFTVQLQRLWAMQRAYQMAMRAAHDGFWEWDPISKRLNVGARLLEILGYDRNFLPTTHEWLNLVHPDDRAHYNCSVAEHLKGKTEYFYCEYRVRAKAGDYRWIASRGLAVRDRKGRAYQMAGSVTDITDRRNYEEEIAFLAQHDQLTGLPNRFLLAERLANALEEARANNSQIAVMFIDLDRFKDINDSLGHSLGDTLLQSVAKRLSALLRNGQTLVRQGGDEFIVIIPELGDIAVAQDLADRMLAALETPFVEDGYPLHIGASVGMSIFPDDADDAEGLLRNADTAMYAAKNAGGGAVLRHTEVMEEKLRHKVSLESRLRQAFEENRLSLYYQPQVSVGSGRIVGAEALLRWNDEGTWIPPDQFIPVAEETGLILPIGNWVIATAIRDLATWRVRHPGLRVAINISPRQFHKEGIGRRILGLMEGTGLPSDAIELEITESMLLEHDSLGTSALQELREAGVKLSLDDFGTGYSSLSYLQRLPFTSLKVDRSFVRTMVRASSEPGEGEPLVRAIIAMAHSLGLEVVAEGVEDAGQLAMLQQLGCDLYQGYLCSPALPSQEFAELADRYLAADISAQL